MQLARQSPPQRSPKLWVALGNPDGPHHLLGVQRWQRPTDMQFCRLWTPFSALDDMPDRVSPEARSRIMASIRSKETLPERVLRAHLHRSGYRFRKNLASLPGCPDIVFTRLRVAVFVDGDFWHGYRYPQWQHKLSDYWRAKIERNIRRDRRNAARLRRAGWRVLRVWEHDVMKDVEATGKRVVAALQSR